MINATTYLSKGKNKKPRTLFFSAEKIDKEYPIYEKVI